MPQSSDSPPGRDTVLSGVALPPTQAPPLHAHIAPRQGAPDLDLPSRMPQMRSELKFEDDTEAQLNAMIGDCRFLLREVAYRSIAAAADAGERLDCLRGALACADVGARLAQSIASLRAVPLDEDRKTAILLEANRVLEAKEGKSGKQ